MTPEEALALVGQKLRELATLVFAHVKQQAGKIKTGFVIALLLAVSQAAQLEAEHGCLVYSSSDFGGKASFVELILPDRVSGPAGSIRGSGIRSPQSR
ncbi:MAG TPA: hypothetical protein VEO02_05000 [Thermoanaerobaculia bacterium]|nr:hypothetical protein [Thermoanaerobaculia bacterium]